VALHRAHPGPFPTVGQSFVDLVGEPILAFAEDTSPGHHDMLYPPCNRALYESVGLRDHPNCEDNFRSAAAELRPPCSTWPTGPKALAEPAARAATGKLALRP
jgi:uncharacterized protein DUF1989